MAEPPASPRAVRLARPGWLDGRLVLGVLLVLVSVVVGARVLSSADRTSLVWAARQDLPAGTALTEDLLVAQRVRLFEADAAGGGTGQGSAYVSADGPRPVGYVVRRTVGRGELLPRAALAAPGQVAQRHVSVPVVAGHLPADLATAQLVDVYLTPDPKTAATTSPATTSPAATSPGAASPGTGPRLVLAAVPVHLVPKTGSFAGSADARSVVLAVPPDDALTLVGALSQGTIDLVRSPAEPDLPGAPAPAAG